MTAALGIGEPGAQHHVAAAFAVNRPALPGGLAQPIEEAAIARQPAGLELGVIELADGSGSLAMVLRREYPKLPPTEDISELASWRTYLAGR